MSKIFRSLLIIGLLVLVILGLNTSNKGIGSLTAEERKPVIGMQIENQQIQVIALGEEYRLSRREISQAGQGIIQDVRQQGSACVDYFKKIWTIFNVLFLK
jgi:hypothetical protein